MNQFPKKHVTRPHLGHFNIFILITEDFTNSWLSSYLDLWRKGRLARWSRWFEDSAVDFAVLPVLPAGLLFLLSLGNLPLGGRDAHAALAGRRGLPRPRGGLQRHLPRPSAAALHRRWPHQRLLLLLRLRPVHGGSRRLPHLSYPGTA